MSEYIGFRCPDDLVASIKAQCGATGQDKTAVIVEMLKGSLPSLPISDRTKLPQESAIYFVWHVQRLLYIGKTGNLRQRLSSHHRLLQFLSIGDDVRVGWLPASRENLEDFESSLIEALEPELNGENFPNGRIQLTVRLDGEKELYNSLKAEAARQNISVNSFAIKIFKAALERRETESPSHPPTPPLEAILEALSPTLDMLVEKKLNARLSNVGELVA